MPDAVPSKSTQIEISPARVFTTQAAIVAHAYGLLLVMPVLIAVLLISLLSIGVFPLLLIPAAAIAATVYFLPFGFGNAHVVKLVRSMSRSRGGDNFIVQVTTVPRSRKGFSSLLEDADDFGRLTFTESELIFAGDSIRCSIPFEQIKEVRPENIGLRGLFLYGQRISVVVSGVPNVAMLQFAERSSYVLPSSRRITKRLFHRLMGAIASRAGSPAEKE